jgi:hypothetical protein
MKKIILTLALTLCFYFIVEAQRTTTRRGSNSGSQSYTTAIGVKFYPGAVTLKHFLNNNRALEGLASFWEWGGRITVLYEIHQDINGAPGLKWYVGPGAHVGVWNDRYKDRYRNRDGGAYIGIDGVLGLDYKIKDAPINLSLDWQPSWNFGDHEFEGFYGGWGGFAIRFTF